MPLTAAHAAWYVATVNYVGTTSAGTPWINITTVTSQTVDYMIPTDQGGPFLAIALTAISSGKQVKINVTGGAWSTLTSISLLSTNAS